MTEKVMLIHHACKGLLKRVLLFAALAGSAAELSLLWAALLAYEKL